jgi:serine/threonine-protein kinase
MSHPDLETYLHCLRKSGLLTEEQIAATVDEVLAAANGSRVRPETLADAFEQAELLSGWQNNKLLKGRYKGFFLGSYKLLGHLATGGMSNIYLGQHDQMHRKVAIKVLPPSLTGGTSHLDRFKLESRVIASLDHPNIVKAFDIAHQDGFHYLVLEYVEGSDLKRLVQKEGVLSYRRAADFIRQAAEGLHHAHERDVVHRDIKPANLLLGEDGCIKILDMGLTRVLGGKEPSLTIAHNERLIGTVDYIAPEQAVNSHNVDRRADIYALGCTLYYLLIGKPPFDQGSQTQRLMAHQMQPLPDIRETRTDAPDALLAILKQMTEKKPARRQGTAAEVARQIKGFLEDLNGSAAEPRSSLTLRTSEITRAIVGGDSPFDAEIPSGEFSNSGSDSMSGEFANVVDVPGIPSSTASLEERQKELNRLEALLQQRQAQLDDRSLRLDQRQASLDDRATALDQEDAQLKVTAKKLSTHRAELQQFREDLVKRQNQLKLQAEELSKKAEQIREAFNRLKTREAELAGGSGF